MSFLAGRLASMEGAYFLQESKQAVSKLAEKVKTKLPPSPSDAIQNEASADVLPEILKHSLPPKIFQSSSVPDSSTFSSSSKWALRTDPTGSQFASSDALNPLRGYVSPPSHLWSEKEVRTKIRTINRSPEYHLVKAMSYITYAGKRVLWELPNSQSGVLASTANERRNDKYTPVSPEKLKAAADGLSQIGKAFFAATVLVFGGSIVAFELAVSKLELLNGDDFRTKGHSFVQSKSDTVREKLTPMRTWVEGTSRKWHLENDHQLKEKRIIKELSKSFRAKTN